MALQVDGPEDVEYNGRGFRSAVSTTGTFQHSFTTPGTYYYIAGGFGDIGTFNKPAPGYFILCVTYKYILLK